MPPKKAKRNEALIKHLREKLAEAEKGRLTAIVYAVVLDGTVTAGRTLPPLAAAKLASAAVGHFLGEIKEDA